MWEIFKRKDKKDKKKGKRGQEAAVEPLQSTEPIEEPAEPLDPADAVVDASYEEQADIEHADEVNPSPVGVPIKQAIDSFTGDDTSVALPAKRDIDSVISDDTSVAVLAKQDIDSVISDDTSVAVPAKQDIDSVISDDTSVAVLAKQAIDSAIGNDDHAFQAEFKLESKPESEREPVSVSVSASASAPAPIPVPKAEAKPEKKKQGLFTKLKEGLKKTRDSLLGSMFVETGEKIDDDFYDELEEAMIISDMGMATTEKLLSQLRRELKSNGIHTRTEAKQVMIRLLAEAMRPERDFLPDADKAVIMIVGVNGVGKTTSIGKLAAMYKSEGKSVMLAAADTFRAAAAEQLTIWAERADVPIIKHGEGADPAAVVFDAIASYRAKKCDLLICDTAGRLHNKVNLMNELAKMRRIIDRELPGVPIEVLLVLDATTGQNAIAQAKVFGENAGLTGIILTKLDGTAKGGVVVAVKDELNLPVRYVGVGEGIDDLQPFDADAFANALL